MTDMVKVLTSEQCTMLRGLIQKEVTLISSRIRGTKADSTLINRRQKLRDLHDLLKDYK